MWSAVGEKMENKFNKNFKCHKFTYTYSFLYDDKKIKDIDEEFIENIDYEDNFYVFLDKFFKEKIKKINVLKYYNNSNIKFKITDLSKNFQFTLTNVYIYLFPNNIGLLTLDVCCESKNLEELYYFNSLFVKIYSKEDSPCYIVKEKSKDKLNIEEKMQNYFNSYLINHKVKSIKKFYYFYNPYKDTKFEKEKKTDLFKTRVGLLEEEKDLMNNISLKHLHYGNFKKILEELDTNICAIHFDTFITSLYIDFVKLNKKVEYYDNFNPLGVNFLYVYTTFIDNSLEKSHKENFAKYEPFLNNKKNKGEIIQSDFFNIYQSDTDWFIISNTQNLINILTKKTFDKSENSIYKQRFLIYLLILFQKLYLHILENKFIFTNSDSLIKKILFISDSRNDYIEFLNNYNFSEVSDEPSISNYYKNLKKNNQIDEKISNLRFILFFNKDIKESIRYVIDNKFIFAIIMFFVIFILPIIYKFISSFLVTHLFITKILTIISVCIIIYIVFFNKYFEKD
jgi:hypothetical protein